MSSDSGREVSPATCTLHRCLHSPAAPAGVKLTVIETGDCRICGGGALWEILVGLNFGEISCVLFSRKMKVVTNNLIWNSSRVTIQQLLAINE